MRILPGGDVVAALAEGDITLAPGDHPLVGTLRLDRPVTLRGEPGARLVGDARDALIRVSADVTLEGLEVARVGGWGSLVVVMSGGLAARACRFVGASSAWRLADRPTLGPDEAWMGAGVDVRGGHASLRDCHLEGPEGYGLSATGESTREVRITGGRVTACLSGVRVGWWAGVRLDDVTVGACGIAGLDVATDGRLRVRGGSVSAGGVGAVYVKDGRAELVGVRVAAPAGSCVWAEGGAEVTLRDVELRGAAGSGVVARGRAKVTLERCRVAEVGHNGLEAQGAAEVVATETTVEAPSATVLAQLAGVVRLERCEVPKPGEWEVWTDGAARVDLGRPATGRVEARVPATAAEWRERLATEDLPRADRDAVAARLPAVVAQEDRAAWRLLGPPGLAALDRLAFGERVQHEVGEPVLLAWSGDAGALVGRRRVVRLGPDLRARWSAPLDGQPIGFFTGAGRLWTVVGRPGSSSEALVAFDDADGRALGALLVSGDVGAARVEGDGVVVWGWDTTGHPTDRCSWRAVGHPATGMGRAEAMTQGQAPAPDGERWDWVRGGAAATMLPSGAVNVRGSWLPGEHRDVVVAREFIVTVDLEGQVWLFDPSGAPLSVRAPRPPAQRLALRGDEVLMADAGGGVVPIRVSMP